MPSTVSIFNRLVFIDPAVSDPLSLMAGVLPQTEVILLDPAEDGVAQITWALAQRSGVESLHIVSHGSPGVLSLAQAKLSPATLPQYRDSVQQWKQALSQGAELLLYGCRVAAGELGAALIEQFQTLVGANIAASTTPVGSASQGGNWTLDVTTGGVAALAFTPAALAAYNSVLADEEGEVLLEEDFSGAGGSTPPTGWQTTVLEGNPVTDVWRFDNPGNRSEISEPFNPGFSDPVAVYDSDFLSDDGVVEDIALESPVFDASEAPGVFLQFDQVYGGIGGGVNASEIFIEASTDGVQWQSVYSSATGGYLINSPTLDLTDELAGAENAQIRFRFDGNWSYLWAVDNIKVVDALPPGVTLPTTLVGVSESNVPDPLSFEFALQSRPDSEVTLNFQVDSTQLQPIAPITFSPDNWFVPQTSVVQAVADGIAEGNDQLSDVQVTITSADENYDGLVIDEVPVQITDNAIPGYTSYRTVEKTYSDLAQLAEANSEIARWIDIGDTYDKVTPGGSEGHDIYALELTNQSTNSDTPKPVLFVQASIHAREYTTTELVTRFAEQLIGGYGTNADTTWLLDYFDVRIVPIVNPDGRKFAEQGYSWRKNTNPGDGTATFPNYGVDLNRNYDSEWGTLPEVGASEDPADLTYQGTAPFSEPESQALSDYLYTVFPDQKGPDPFDPAPDDATGVYLDIHSFGNLVLYPFGWTNEPAPNQEGLRNLGLKFGYFTGVDGQAYDVQQAIGLYPTTGTTDDWAYQTFGVAAYTLELGTEFFEQSNYFETVIVPEMLPGLVYAAKSAYRPYQTSAGPDSLAVSLDLGQVVAGTTTPVILSATADATRYDDGNESSAGLSEGLDLPAFRTIAAARYSIDAPSWVEGTQTYELQAADGSFDSTVEELVASLDTTGLTAGRHTIFVESLDAEGNYGVPTAAFLDVLEAPAGATIQGTEESDSLDGGEGAEVVYGFAGGDSIDSGFGDDLVLAGAGNDAVKASGGNDTVYGGEGDDYLDGGLGNDTIYGEAGDDRLIGYSGNDTLYGGTGNDWLSGGEGDDILYAGGGVDSLRGSGGADQFWIVTNFAPAAAVTVTDFQVGTDVVGIEGLSGVTGFGDLILTQLGANTLIGADNAELGLLLGVQASNLTADSFAIIG